MADRPDPSKPDPDDEFGDVRTRLDALERKLDSKRPDPMDARLARNERTNFGLAVRVSSDFIAAIFVGGALGWFLDSFAGTSPFGLVILLLLGFAAGVLNVMRTLGLVNMPKGVAPEAAKPASPPPAEQAARRRDTEESEREGR